MEYHTTKRACGVQVSYHFQVLIILDFDFKSTVTFQAGML
jgi:hypothetical protein